jgi:hypothetical protein
MSKIIKTAGGISQYRISEEIFIRQNPSGRMEIKASVYEDGRGITGLTLQRFNRDKPHEDFHFALRPSEITQLLQFIAGIRTVELPSASGRHVSDIEMQEIVLNKGQLIQKLKEKPDVLLEALESEELSKDLISVGYRRAQLKIFHNLLDDEEYFIQLTQEKNKTGEALWQDFFEQNRWIFGYGLSYQFLSNLDNKKLEQYVSGNTVGTLGKRTDGLMKTRGKLNSLCFVEIKTHKTSLLEDSNAPYRSGVWKPSNELSGGVAQIQVTVDETIRQLGFKLEPTHNNGNPTGETLFNIEPQSFLIIGNLDEFITPDGTNEQKLRSFELFRRNTNSPKIFTFDELYHRAKFIVEEAI